MRRPSAQGRLWELCVPRNARAFGVVHRKIGEKPTDRYDQLSSEGKEQYVELLKERIYATITLIAVLASQLLHAEAIKPSSLLLSLFGTVFALWGATIIAHRLSYRAVHGEDRTRQNYVNLVKSSFGLLIPAIVPAIVTLGSVIGFYATMNAIIVSIALLLVTLFGFAVMATSRVYSSWMRILLIAFIEMMLGFVIVGIKILAE